MNKRRITAAVVVMIQLFLLCICSMPVSALGKEADSKLVSFTVTERNGVMVNDFLIQRGFPLKDGILKQDEEVYILNIDTGEKCLTQYKTLETYSSGYVKWLSVSMSIDLVPNEKKNFAVMKGKSGASSSLSYTIENGIISVDNGGLKADFDNSGLLSLNFKGEEIFDSRGVFSTCIQEEYMYSMTSGKIELVEAGEVYVIIKISAEYGNSAMRTEQTYTIVNESMQISCTNAYISHNGVLPQNGIYVNSKINSLHETFSFNSGFDSVEYGENKSAIKDNPIVSSDYASVYNTKTGTCVSFASKDIERYRGVASGYSCNGFYYENGEFIYAPIFYKTDYGWPDGLRRTTHLEIILDKGKTKDIGAVLNTTKTTPEVIIDKNAFIEAGIIESDKMSSLAKTQLDAVKWLKDKRVGSISAGNILFTFDKDLATCDTTGIVRLGETEYNIWYGQISSQDPDIFDMVNESCECWSDVVVYRGSVKEARGLPRYRARFGYGESASSHGYYGEFSSIYMAYLMTGNEYFRDTCYEIADVTYRLSMAASPMNGYHVVSAFGWPKGIIEVYSDYKDVEFRSIFTLRALYNCYNLFKEERFKELAESMVKWSEVVQEPDGSWTQIQKTMGEAFVSDDQATGNDFAVGYKNYLMLYTLRAHCEYYRQTKNESVIPQLVKFADYLISEMGENDWMWNPSRDKQEMNEDFSRGKSPYHEMMSSEIFHTVYNATGDEKYFEAFCRVLSNYLASARTSGLAAMKYNHPDYQGGKIESSQITGQNTTLLHMDAAYCKTFDENRDLAIKMGYQGLVSIFADGASYTPEKISHQYPVQEIGANLYENNSERYLYVGNNSGVASGEWDKNVKLNVAGQASLWTNVTCNFNNIYETVIEKELKLFDSVYSRELPIRVQEISGEATATVEKYDENQISFNISSNSGKIKLLIQDGDFPIKSDMGYSVSISGGSKKSIYIKKGGNLVPGDDGLLIELDFQNEDTFVFYDLINHWSENDVMAMYYKGIVKGVSDTHFAPDQNVIKKHVLYFIMRTLGISDEEAVNTAIEYGIIDDATGLDDYATREDVISYCMKAIRYVRGDIKTDKIRVYSGTLVNSITDDKIAVEKDVASLEFETNILEHNIQLPNSGIYGSTIEWIGGNEYLTKEGLITKPSGMESDATSVLTAVVTRGAERMTKDFEFIIKNSANINAASGSFGNAKFDIMPLTGTYEFEIEATPMAAPFDWCIGFYNTAETTVSSYNDLSLIVRFSPTGKIDAYNGGGYSAESDLSYESGKTYTFNISGSISAGAYSATVTMPDGKKYVLAKDYKYRGTAKLGGVLNGGVSVGVGSIGIINKLSISPSVKGTGAYGYIDGDEYFSITRDDFKIDMDDEWNYFSSLPQYVDKNGHIVKHPDEIIDVIVVGAHKDLNMFSDIEDSNPANIEDILTAEIIGLVKGDDENRLNPKSVCTRAETLTFIRRLYDLCNVKVIVQ